MKTLVIVDVQNDFMPGGALEVRQGDIIVPVINRILPNFDLVVATQDWHPENHKSFAANHPGKEPFEEIELNGLSQKLWPIHCVQNTQGAEFHAGLKTGPIEAIFRKGMDPEIDSYSGFYDNGQRKRTGLAGYLRDKKAKDVYFCGLAGDICVNFTLLDALREGFSASLIEDAAIPLQMEKWEQVRNNMKEKGASLITSEDI